MSRVEHIGDATLYLGDCREIAQGLDRADHCITDPPYEAEAHTAQRRAPGSGGAKRLTHVIAAPLPFSAIDSVLRSAAAAEIARLSGGWVLVFCQQEAAHLWRGVLEDAGATYRRTMIWVKPDGMPQFSGDRPGIGYETIVTCWAGEGRSRWNGGGSHGVFTVSKSDKGLGHGGPSHPHPTTKPIRLVMRLVNLFTNTSETIFDPFMGSGTTGIAALRLGRKFLGIEIDERWFDIACKRIDQEARQGRLDLGAA